MRLYDGVQVGQTPNAGSRSFDTFNLLVLPVLCPGESERGVEIAKSMYPWESKPNSRWTKRTGFYVSIALVAAVAVPSREMRPGDRQAQSRLRSVLERREAGRQRFRTVVMYCRTM